MSSDVFKLLIIPDVHAPYHSLPAWSCVLDVAENWRPEACVQLGDFGSYDSVSSHDHDPTKVLPLEQEVAGCNKVLDQLDRSLKRGGCVKSNKWMLEGNHSVRISRYVQKMAPELRPFVDWREMLKMHRRGWKVLPYKTSLKLGKLSLTHDVGRAGVQAARQSVIDMGDSIAIGHTHRISVHYQGALDGARHVGATLGWLGDPEAIDYRHRDLVRRDWQHGFGVAYFLASGEFWLQAVPIIRGRCVIDGRIYGGK